MKKFKDLKELAIDMRKRKELYMGLEYENMKITIQIYDKGTTELNISLNDYEPSFKVEERSPDKFTVAVSTKENPETINYAGSVSRNANDSIESLKGSFEDAFKLDEVIMVLLNGK